MSNKFAIEDLQENAPAITPIQEALPFEGTPAKANPCVTVYQYRDKWAVTPAAGQNYIFSTLGQALNEAKRFLQGETE